MRVVRDDHWHRRGLTILWHANALGCLAGADAVVSLHELFALARAWPDELPAADGNALVVAGLEGCLDALDGDDAEPWLTEHIKPLLHRFQDHYQGAAALVFWMPSGRQRMIMDLVSGEYSWRRGPGGSAAPVAIGRALFGGAQGDLARIVIEGDPDGDGWAGLTLERSS